MNERLLVALEDTPRATELLRSCAPLAQALNLRLCAVHLRPLSGPLRLRAVEDFPYGHSGVACLDAPPELGEVPLERIVIEAPEVAQGLLEAASQLEARLMIMGTHGREGLSRLLEGSVAERVLRRAPCPTLLLREGISAPLAPLLHLLVPVPAEGGDERAVVTAVRLALALGARLTLLHVLVHSASTYQVAYGPYPSAEDQRVFAVWKLEGVRRLEAARAYAAALGGEALQLETATLETFDLSLSAKILSFAESQGVDLIVLGTSARRGFERLLLGSVAEGVFHHAHVPVLLLGPQASALEPRALPETLERPALEPPRAS